MKKQALLFLGLATLSMIYSCKKDDDSVTNEGTIPVKEDHSEKATGFLVSTLTINDATDLLNPNSYFEEATATFVRSIQENTPVLADTVYINSLGMLDASGNIHSLTVADNFELNTRDTCNWTVVDTTHPEIPSFKFNYRVPYPSILGKIPDTVIRSKGINLPIQIAGADSVIMAIDGDTLNNGGFKIKTLAPPLANYTFAYEDVKSIRPSKQDGLRRRIIIQAYKTTVIPFDGIYMRFTKVYRFNASFWVKREPWD